MYTIQLFVHIQNWLLSPVYFGMINKYYFIQHNGRIVTLIHSFRLLLQLHLLINRKLSVVVKYRKWLLYVTEDVKSSWSKVPLKLTKSVSTTFTLPLSTSIACITNWICPWVCNEGYNYYYVYRHATWLFSSCDIIIRLLCLGVWISPISYIPILYLHHADNIISGEAYEEVLHVKKLADLVVVSS